MQRRAAAGYAGLLFLVGIVAFSLIATATPPELTFQNPDHRLSDGENATIGGTEYNVTVTAEVSEPDGGGHGGGGGAELVRSGTLTTVDESARQTATWANGSQVTYLNDTWTVSVVNNESARLIEVIDREAILQNDSSVRNTTQTIDGVTYVVSVNADGGNGTLIPADDYFPAPAAEPVSVGDEIQFDGRTVTVTRVTSDGVLLVWTAPETIETSVSDGANVTVGNATYYAQFPDNETLVLSDNFERVEQFQEEREQFETHRNGLWGVTILGSVGGVLLVGLSYMPSRY